MSLLVVTGASGFIGSALVRRLAAAGARVVGVDRRPGRVPGSLHLQADLLDDDPAVEAALRDADAVFHLAARPGVRDEAPHADRLRYRDNVLATARVLRSVPPATPLVVVSSSSVYGGAAPGRASREDAPLRPRGGYARSKLAVEAGCTVRAAAGGHVGVARPFTVVGEGQRADMAVARWIAAARDGRPLEVLGGVGRTRDLTDVRDVVEGLVRMAEREVTGPVNLGTGVSRSLGEIVAAVAAATATSPPVVVRAVSRDEPSDTRADVTHCRRLLGFTPATDLQDVVARQVRAGAADVRDEVPVPA